MLKDLIANWFFKIELDELKKLRGDNFSLLEKVKAQNDFLYYANKDKTELSDKIVKQNADILGLNSSLADFSRQVEEKNQAIEKMKTALALGGVLKVPKPDFIDDTKNAYKARVNLEEEVIMINQRYIYDPELLLKDFVIEKNIRAKPKNQKLMTNWDYTIKALTYKYDVIDYWQLALFTLLRGRGDCEDGSVVFVTLCKLSGIRADEIFNAIGPTRFGYHSYPIVKFDADEILKTDGKNWYICESTLDIPVERPLKLLNSEYWIDEGGIANWQFEGQVNNKYKDEFNLKGMTASNPNEEKKIVDTPEKRKAINDYWKEQLEKGE